MEIDILYTVSKYQDDFEFFSSQQQERERRQTMLDVWVAASALQKAIRRGNRCSAHRAAAFLQQHDKKRLWRRLVVIALEDIGCADLELAGQIVWASGKRAWRDRNGGEPRIVFGVVESLCRALKNRDACDLAVIADCDPALHEAREMMASASSTDLKGIFLDDKTALLHRMLAAWYLAGTVTFPASKLRPRGGRLVDLMECLMELDLSADTVELLRSASSKSREAIAIGLAVLYAAFKRPWQGTVQTEDVSSPGEIGGWATEAFDMHTRPGGRAIREFTATCTPVRQLVNEVSNPYQKAKAVAWAVFRVEGSRVDRRLVIPQFANISPYADMVSMRQFGLPRAIAEELLCEVERNLPELHSVRLRGIQPDL